MNATSSVAAPLKAGQGTVVVAHPLPCPSLLWTRLALGISPPTRFGGAPNRNSCFTAIAHGSVGRSHGDGSSILVVMLLFWLLVNLATLALRQIDELQMTGVSRGLFRCGGGLGGGRHTTAVLLSANDLVMSVIGGTPPRCQQGKA